jgi:hypothetical protein
MPVHPTLFSCPGYPRQHGSQLLVWLSTLALLLLAACIPAPAPSATTPTALPLVPVAPGVQLRIDGAPELLGSAADRKPQGVFVMVPLRLITEPSGADTSALGPFLLVDGSGAEYAPVRDLWVLKWIGLNRRRLPLLDAAAKPSGFLIQTQSYRWEVKPLGPGRVIDAFLLYDVPPGARRLALRYDNQRLDLPALQPGPTPGA